MAYIDTTYFTDARGIYIPGIGTNANSNLAVFTPFLEAKEKQVLIDALGFELYTAFVAGIGDGAKYDDLLNGKTYQIDICGVATNVRWNGLVNTDKESFIAYYTYWHWQLEKVGDTALTGVVRNENENSRQVTPHKKMVDAWNNFVRLYLGEDENSTQRSLFQFIRDTNNTTPDTYANWVFKLERRQNTFGI